MADSLVDLGGGVKMVNPEKFIGEVSDPTKKMANTLSILDLAGKIQDRPLDRAKKEIDLSLSQNELNMIDVKNKKMRVDLESAVQGEKRAQYKFIGDAINQALDMSRIDPNLGMQMFQKAIPNAAFIPREKGAYTVVVPSKEGGFQTFNVDPNKILKPEDRLSSESNLRKQFEDAPETRSYSKINLAYKRAQKAVKNPTGPGDISLVFDTVTSLDPNTGVKEGEIGLVQNVAGISNLLLNKMKKLENGTLFGEEASATRKELFDIIERGNNNLEQIVLQIGQNNYGMAKRAGLDAESSVRPVGSLGVDSFIPFDILDQIPVEQLSTAQKQRLLKYKQEQTSGNN
jgi:hypothetical protein